MSNNATPADSLADADNILKVWTVNADFKLKDLTVEQFQSDHDELETVLAQLQKKDDEMTPLRNRRDALTSKINGACTRARAGIRARALIGD